MKLKSFAKINLALDILGKRPDGYHDIETIFQQILLHDEIELLEIPSPIEISCDISEINNKENLAYKAALLLKETYNVEKGVKIAIKKNIPLGAGLSGGSSNAACVLSGPNDLWKLDLSQKDLLFLAAQLGSDVSFHLIGGTCFGSGRGEIVKKLSALPMHYVVLVFPEFSISTADAYAGLRQKIGKARACEKFLKGYDLSFLHNDFEESIFMEYPILSDIKQDLGKHSLLSGSGSCVFGLFSDAQEAKRIYDNASQKYETVFLTQTIKNDI